MCIQNIVLINEVEVVFDVRFVDDNYIAVQWEEELIRSRIKFNSPDSLTFMIPNEENLFYSLLHHLLINHSHNNKKCKQKLKFIHSSNLFPNYASLIDWSRINDLNNNYEYRLNHLGAILKSYMKIKHYKAIKSVDTAVGFDQTASQYLNSDN